jgi:sugar phosphate isomerase/epimerase
MTVGFTADRFRFLSCADVLGLYRWNGLRFAEVTTAVFEDPETAVRRSRGMALGLHLPNAGNKGYDFSSQDRAESIMNDMAHILRFAAGFRLRYGVFHPPETGKRRVTDFYIRNLKNTGLPLVLENIRGMDPEAFHSFFKGMKKALGDSLWGICLDIPHAHLTNGDWQSYFLRLVRHVRVVHLSDCRNGEDRHLPFGAEGELHLPSILRFMRRKGFDGFINFEILPPSLPSAVMLFHMMRRIQENGCSRHGS